MTTPQQPSVPVGMAARGAVDLGALAQAREAQRAAAERAANPQAAATQTVIDVTTATFQVEVMERSMQVPVVVDLWATWCGPCKQLSPVLEKLAADDGGKWVLAKVDVDAEPQIAQAFQVQSIPSVVAIVGGRPVPLFQGALPEAQVRQYIDELLKIAAQAGLVGEPTQQASDTEPTPDPLDPLFDEADRAFGAQDWPAVIAAYQQVQDIDPTNADAQAGILRAELMQRVAAADPEVLATAATNPADVAAACLAADVAMSQGDEKAAFDLLIATVRATGGDERAQAKDHLIQLFKLLPADDAAVSRARTELANALF